MLRNIENEKKDGMSLQRKTFLCTVWGQRFNNKFNIVKIVKMVHEKYQNHVRDVANHKD